MVRIAREIVGSTVKLSLSFQGQKERKESWSYHEEPGGGREAVEISW